MSVAALENVTKPADPVVSAERIKRAMLQRFNPIRNLTPELLSTHLDSWRAGYIRELALVLDTIQERDDMLTTVIPKRKMAVSRLDWEVLTVDDSPEAQAHKAALEFFYDNVRATDVLDTDQVGGFKLLVRQMMDAVGMKYAVHEIVWEAKAAPAPAPEKSKSKIKSKTGGDNADPALNPNPNPDPIRLPGTLLTAEFRRCPLWFFERTEGRLRYLPGEGSAFGVELVKGEWLVTVGQGLMIPCAIAWMFKRLPLQDWLNYSEKFGMPAIHGKTNAAKDSDEWDDFVEAVGNFANDFALVTNIEAAIELVKADGGSGALPQPALVERMDRAMAAMWRGGDLSTMSKDGQAVGSNSQSEEGDILLEDDAAQISETLNHKVEPRVIEYLFGPGVTPLAYVQIQVPKETDINREITVDNHLIKHGAQLGLSDALERYGRVEVDGDERTMTAPEPKPSPFGFGNAKESGPDLAKLAQAFAEDLAPLRERLEAILAIKDEPIFRSRLRGFLAELPQLAKDISADPASAAVLEKLMSTAATRGPKE